MGLNRRPIHRILIRKDKSKSKWGKRLMLFDTTSNFFRKAKAWVESKNQARFHSAGFSCFDPDVRSDELTAMGKTIQLGFRFGV